MIDNYVKKQPCICYIKSADENYTGSVIIDNCGIFLSILSSFRQKNLETIICESKIGKIILTGLSLSNFSFQHLGLLDCKYRLAIIGNNKFQKPDDICYDLVSFNYTGLNCFINISSILTHFELDESGGCSKLLNEVNIDSATSIEVLTRDYDIRFVPAFSFGLSDRIVTIDDCNTPNIKENYTIDVTRIDKNKIKIDEIQKLNFTFKLFLSACLKNKVNVIEIVGEDDKVKNRICINLIDEIQKIEYSNDGLWYDFFDRWNMDIGKCFDNILSCSIDQEEFLKSVYNRFESQALTYKSDFKNILPGLESFLRLNYTQPNLNTNETQIQKFLLETLENCSISNSESRKRFKKYINEYSKHVSLSDRIKNQLKSSIKEFENLNEDLKLIETMRNDLFHGNHITDEKYKEYYISDCHNILEKIHYWFFLKFIGFSDESCDRGVSDYTVHNSY
jgi:hypothetical protein